MLKAVVSSGNMPVNTDVTLKSVSLEGSDSKAYETRVSQNQPFFQNPFSQRLSTLEGELGNILASKMSDDQKLVLYKSALNELFITDRMRKNKNAPQVLRAPPNLNNASNGSSIYNSANTNVSTGSSVGTDSDASSYSYRRGRRIRPRGSDVSMLGHASSLQQSEAGYTASDSDSSSYAKPPGSITPQTPPMPQLLPETPFTHRRELGARARTGPDRTLPFPAYPDENVTSLRRPRTRKIARSPVSLQATPLGAYPGEEGSESSEGVKRRSNYRSKVRLEL